MLTKGKVRVVCFFSKALVGIQLNWSVREKECFGIIYGVRLFEDLLDVSTGCTTAYMWEPHASEARQGGETTTGRTPIGSTTEAKHSNGEIRKDRGGDAQQQGEVASRSHDDWPNDHSVLSTVSVLLADEQDLLADQDSPVHVCVIQPIRGHPFEPHRPT